MKMFGPRVNSGATAIAGAITCMGLICSALLLPNSSSAQTPQLTAHLADAADTVAPLQVPVLVDVRRFQCGQAVNAATSLSPFPIHLRLGGMLSPTSKLAVGADVTITGVHLMPSVNTRIDGDVILGGNLGGSQTFFPVTLDELYSKTLPGGTAIYFGPGAGMFFGGRTRFGGKVALGASVNRFGVEADLDFAGIGNPLFLLQARVGL